MDGHSHDLDQVKMKNKEGKDVLRSACGTKLEAIGYVRITPDGTITTGLYKWDNEENAVELLGLGFIPMNEACKKAKETLAKTITEVVATSVDLLTKRPRIRSVHCPQPRNKYWELVCGCI